MRTEYVGGMHNGTGGFTASAPYRVYGPFCGLALGPRTLVDQVAVLTEDNDTYYLTYGSPLPLKCDKGKMLRIYGLVNAATMTAGAIRTAATGAEILVCEDSWELACFVGMRRAVWRYGTSSTATVVPSVTHEMPVWGRYHWDIGLENTSAGSITYLIEGLRETSDTTSPYRDQIGSGTLGAGADVRFVQGDSSAAETEWYDWILITLTGVTNPRTYTLTMIAGDLY